MKKNCIRFFTQEQINEIRTRLTALQGAKDSQFTKALPLTGDEGVAIVQGGENRLTTINDLRLNLITIDTEVTEESQNAVTSAAIYNYIEDILGHIPEYGDAYLYLKSDTELFKIIFGLIPRPGTYDLNALDAYILAMYDTVANGSFIIIDNAICVSHIEERENNALYLQLNCISDTKYINLLATRNFPGTRWFTLHGTICTENTHLISNQDLTRELALYVTISSLDTKLNSYLRKDEINNFTDQYPTLDSDKLVTSGGVYEFIENTLVLKDYKSYIYVSSDSEMVDYLIHGIADGRSQEILNTYCEVVHTAILNNNLIVIDDAIGDLTYYDKIESDNGKVVSLTLRFLTTKLDIKIGIIGAYDAEGNLEQWYTLPYYGSMSDLNYLIDMSKLNTKLGEYAKKLELDGGLNTINNRITTFKNDYDARMQVTPQFHRLNWITVELDEDLAHTSTAWEITDNSTAAESALKRLTSLISAVFYNTLYNYLPKIMTFFQETVVNVTCVGTSSNPTSATVKTFDGENVTTYLIEKQQRTGTSEIYLSVTKSVATVVQ